jgi:hypothetical protein
MRMVSIADPKLYLPLGRSTSLCQHFKDLTHGSSDWLDNLGFIIIPSFESGESFSMTRGLKSKELFENRMGVGLRDLSLVKSLGCV